MFYLLVLEIRSIQDHRFLLLVPTASLWRRFGLHTCPRVRLLCFQQNCRMMICSRVRIGLPGGCVDVLSEVLKVVKLQGAMFYNGEFSSPWSFCSPASRTVAPYLAPGAGHIIIYHLLTEGHASARLSDGDPIALDAGDLVIFPHGDPHIIENGPPTKTVDLAKELARLVAQGLKLARFGGGGEVTKFICGFMACDPQLSQVFLSGLPPVFKVSIRNDASGRWLE